MKKTTFKSFLKRKINAVAKQYLFNLRSKHSKSTNLLHRNELKDYLTSDKISLEGKKLLFAMKTRGVNVKTNFKTSYSDLTCRLCGKQDEAESESHLLKCDKVISENDLKSLVENIAYNDIFGTLNQQINAIKVWCKIFKVWKIKLEASKLSPSGHQAHLPSGQSDSYASITTTPVDSPSPDDDSNCIVYDFG